MDDTRYSIGYKLLNRFEIQRIMLGSMGIVYICSDSAGNLHALKTFQDKYLLSDIAKERFVEEANVWIKLGYHHNIVQAKWVERIDGKPYIMLECVLDENGQALSLTKKIKQGSLSMQLILDYAIQICLGMHYVQVRQPGLIHRDLTPNNILISQDGAVKVTDFGIAIFTQRGNTEQIRFLGDPAYMSPEQRAGGTIDLRSDIFSFGCILYEMLRKKQYKERALHALSKADLFASIPAELIDIPQRCLCTDPNERYRCFLDIASDLRRVYEDFGFVLLEQTNKSFADTIHISKNSWIEFRLFDNRDALLDAAASFNELGQYQDTLTYLDRWFKENAGFEENIDVSYHDPSLDYFGPEEPEDENFVWVFPVDKEGIKKAFSRAYITKAIAETNLGKNVYAEQSLMKALSLTPNDFNAWYNYGEFLFNVMQNSQGAINAYQQAIKIRPDDDYAWTSLGVVLIQTGDKEQGLSCFDRALEINPRMIQALGNKGVALIDLGKISEAYHIFTKLTQIDPGNAKGWYYRGLILLNNQNPEGVECIERARKLAVGDDPLQNAINQVIARFIGG